RRDKAGGGLPAGQTDDGEEDHQEEWHGSIRPRPARVGEFGQVLILTGFAARTRRFDRFGHGAVRAPLNPFRPHSRIPVEKPTAGGPRRSFRATSAPAAVAAAVPSGTRPHGCCWPPAPAVRRARPTCPRRG